MVENQTKRRILPQRERERKKMKRGKDRWFVKFFSFAFPHILFISLFVLL